MGFFPLCLLFMLICGSLKMKSIIIAYGVPQYKQRCINSVVYYIDLCIVCLLLLWIPYSNKWFRLHNFFTFVLLICVIKNSISCFVATSELFNIVKHITWACVWWFPWAYAENYILCVVHLWQVSDFGLTIANPKGSPPKNSV